MYQFDQSLELFNRASKVIPGGIYGHVTPATVIPGASPYYASKAEGAYYWDADNNKYIDFMCGYGPTILGYNHPEIEEAARKQKLKGSVFNHPTDKMVELAEVLTERINFADWAVFAKNGSDLTTWAVQVARETTGNKGILKAKGSYHGVDAWCSPGKGGIIDEDLANVYHFEWNDLQNFEEEFQKNLQNLACVILTPYHHPVFQDNLLSDSDFLPNIQKICNKHGVVFILDDVRAGFRLHENGSHEYFNFQPDISVYCKALGNGHAISAAVGRDNLKVPASKVFLTGSYWNDAVSMAAAIQCLKIVQRDKVPDIVEKLGSQLKAGLETTALKHGFELKITGPVSMPYLRFKDEDNLYKIQEFCKICISEGAFFHPHHNWFLSAAHKEKEILDAIQIADFAFAKMKPNE